MLRVMVTYNFDIWKVVLNQTALKTKHLCAKSKYYKMF